MAEESAAGLREEGADAHAVSVDVTAPDLLAVGLLQTLDRTSRVDILVNNAGIAGQVANLGDLSDADWDETVGGNLTSVFYCCRAVLSSMRDQGSGSIVNMASVTGKEGNPNQVPYSVAKAGVIALTKALSREVAPDIRVNCVAPALIQTRMLDTLPDAVVDYALERPTDRPRRHAGRGGRRGALPRVRRRQLVTGQCYDVSGGRSAY